MDRDATWKKCGAVALSAFVVIGSALIAGSALLGCGYQALKFTYNSPMMPAFKTLSYAAIGVTALIGVGIFNMETTTLRNEFTANKYNRDIVNALGGVEALNALPVVNLPRTDDYQISITPEDVQHHRISRGVDATNRPFIAFLVENIQTQKEHVEVLHTRLTDSSIGIWVTGGRRYLPDAIFNTENDEHLNRLRNLVNNEPHGIYKLVPSAAN